MSRAIIKEISREFFYFISATVVLGFFFELIWPNSVLAYFNLNYLLVIWLFSWLALL